MHPFTSPAGLLVTFTKNDIIENEHSFVTKDGRLSPEFEAILDADKHAIICCGYCGQNVDPIEEEPEPQSVKEALARPVLVQVKDALTYVIGVAQHAHPHHKEMDDSDPQQLEVTTGWVRECRDVLNIVESELTKTQKGELHGACNRTACDSHLPATHYNSSTRLHYCIVCARTINEFNPGLCVPVEVTPEILCYLEDCAAISERFFQQPQQQKFYDRYAEQLSGFPGVWMFVAHAAKIFTELNPDYDEIDWIASTEAYAHHILHDSLDGEYVADIQNEKWLLPIAAKSLVKQ